MRDRHTEYFENYIEEMDNNVARSLHLQKEFHWSREDWKGVVCENKFNAENDSSIVHLVLFLPGTLRIQNSC